MNKKMSKEDTRTFLCTCIERLTSKKWCAAPNYCEKCPIEKECHLMMRLPEDLTSLLIYHYLANGGKKEDIVEYLL